MEELQEELKKFVYTQRESKMISTLYAAFVRSTAQKQSTDYLHPATKVKTWVPISPERETITNTSRFIG